MMIPQGKLYRERGRKRGSNKSQTPAGAILQYRQSHDYVSESARREVHTCTSSSG